MLNDVAGSITFSLSSPDSFTAITGAQGEPALVCEKVQGASGGLANSGALEQMPVELHGAGQ